MAGVKHLMIKEEKLKCSFNASGIYVTCASVLEKAEAVEKDRLLRMRYLYIHGTLLQRLPSKLFSLFPMITKCDLTGNRLLVVPKELFSLTKLFLLSLMDNALSRLPSGLSRLTRLQWIRLSGNPRLPLQFHQA